jgi:cell growth-regulating nucleolar protein
LLIGKTKVNPQDSWMVVVGKAVQFAEKAPPSIRTQIGRLSDLNASNIPRNQKKFVNFIKNSLRLHNENTINEMWAFIEQFKESSAEVDASTSKTNSTPDVSTVSTSGVSTKHQIQKDHDNNVDSQIAQDKEEKKKKKRSKEAEAVQEVEIQETQIVEDREEKKNKKRSKDANNIKESEIDDLEDNTIVVKKKSKHSKSESTEEAAVVDQEEIAIETKKSKKKKHRESDL